MSGAEDRIPEASLLAYHAEALPQAERRALAQRIDGDPQARAQLAEWERQDIALQSLYGPLGEEALPPGIAQMLDEARAEPAPPVQLPPTRRIVAAASVMIVIGGALGWVAHDLSTPPAPDSLADAARAYRTYVVEDAHPVEVPATDMVHLTSWVNARLGQPVRLPDLSAAGYTLMGGRILPGTRGAAALFMYQNQSGRRIALYAESSPGSGASPMRAFDEGGTRGFWWQREGLAYAITGMLPPDSLRRITTMAYDQLL